MDNDIEDRAGGGTSVLAPGLSSLSDDELTVSYDRTLAASRQAEWDCLAVEAEIDRRRMYADDGAASLREWICIRRGEGDRAAYHQARIARRLGDYPGLSAALADGRISVAHVRVLLTLARLAGTDDDRLVDLGETHTVPQIETICRAARPVSPADDDGGHRQRHLRWRYDNHGSVRIHGRLHGPEALTVTNLIAAIAETVDDDPAPGEGPAPFDTRCADALIELCTTQINHSTARRAEVVIHVPLDALTHHDSDDHKPADDDPSNDRRSHNTDRPDTDGPDTDGPEAGPDCGGHPGAPGPGDESGCAAPSDDGDLVDEPSEGLRADIGPAGGDPTKEDRCAGLGPDGWDPYGLDCEPGDHHAGAAMSWDGTVLSSAALQRLLCDCSLRLTVDDGAGRAVGIGFRSRSLPHWLLGQLRWRDGSCRFPGCERTRWVHGHHLVHWPHGPTNLANLVLLCSTHHRQVHEGGWDVRGDPAGQLNFVSPAGHTYATQPATHLKPPSTRRSPGRRKSSPPARGPTSNGP